MRFVALLAVQALRDAAKRDEPICRRAVCRRRRSSHIMHAFKCAAVERATRSRACVLEFVCVFLATFHLESFMICTHGIFWSRVRTFIRNTYARMHASVCGSGFGCVRFRSLSYLFLFCAEQTIAERRKLRRTAVPPPQRRHPRAQTFGS